ncbi:hypothetical protein E4U42_003698 [Claviceps africana]|uniref:DUF7704 domain-containing protein n=1 Tax=Claviceps africana TaxID=83212 RepID=A0A8K0J681_9HYPO|nr:hypothetical protein E4U42_003698 [Claviceps africana]
MTSSLPTVPRLVFTVIEPISLLAGFLGAVKDPAWFVSQQIPQKEVSAAIASENSIMLAWQLGNLYLLMAFVGLFVLNSTSEIKVVRSYLWALWLGDIGHVAFSCYGLGKERMMNPWEWNPLAWGNIAFTIWLFSMRSAYFLGFFGPDKPVAAIRKKSA